MENDPLLKEEKCKVKELPPRQGCFVLGEIMINWRFRECLCGIIVLLFSLGCTVLFCTLVFIDLYIFLSL
jgi:hypothetical protein